MNAVANAECVELKSYGKLAERVIGELRKKISIFDNVEQSLRKFLETVNASRTVLREFEHTFDSTNSLWDCMSTIEATVRFDYGFDIFKSFSIFLHIQMF